MWESYRTGRSKRSRVGLCVGVFRTAKRGTHECRRRRATQRVFRTTKYRGVLRGITWGRKVLRLHVDVPLGFPFLLHVAVGENFVEEIRTQRYLYKRIFAFRSALTLGSFGATPLLLPSMGLEGGGPK